MTFKRAKEYLEKLQQDEHQDLSVAEFRLLFGDPLSAEPVGFLNWKEPPAPTKWRFKNVQIPPSGVPNRPVPPILRVLVPAGEAS